MSDSSTSGGIGIPSVLTIVFVVLKLTKVIDWSWWWVLSPLWISSALAVLIIISVTIWSDRKSKLRKERLERIKKLKGT